MNEKYEKMGIYGFILLAGLIFYYYNDHLIENKENEDKFIITEDKEKNIILPEDLYTNSHSKTSSSTNSTSISKSSSFFGEELTQKYKKYCAVKYSGKENEQNGDLLSILIIHRFGYIILTGYIEIINK